MIRPFQPGDIFLIQRLERQSAKLNVVQALLKPRSATWTALKAVNPLDDAKITTYVLNQHGHKLARAGFLQAQKRPHRPELDLTLLSPALDTPTGHPAIWEKLLSHLIQEAAHQQLARIYVDVPDQPLPVSTFGHVGFRIYKHQTIWRLQNAPAAPLRPPASQFMRPTQPGDEKQLEELYLSVTPSDVRKAEGLNSGEYQSKALILDNRGYGACRSFVLDEGGRITGCLHLIRGKRGTWVRLWTDTLSSDNWRIHGLLSFALDLVWRESLPIPVYLGVNDYHGGLSTILPEYGFAPFTDRANMVKHVLVWAREAVPARAVVVEPVGEVAITSYTPSTNVLPWTVDRPTPPDVGPIKPSVAAPADGVADLMKPVSDGRAQGHSSRRIGRTPSGQEASAVRQSPRTHSFGLTKSGLTKTDLVDNIS